MVTKGPYINVMAVCSSVKTPGGAVVNTTEARGRIDRRFEALSSEGYRILGVAFKEMNQETTIARDQEAGMTFLGLLVFSDPPKSNIDALVTSYAAILRL